MSTMTKQQVIWDEYLNRSSYISVITSMLSNLIEAEGLPQELEDDFDFFLITTLLTGKGFIVKGEDGLLHYTHGERVEPWDDFGFGKNYITFTSMGQEYKGTLNVDGVVVYPYSSRRPINIIRKTAEHLTELDTSENFLIRWARVAPILLGRDTKTVEALKNVVKSVMTGNMIPALSDNILDRITTGTDTQPVVTLDVMQPDRIRDLQYLGEYRDRLKKQIFELFGLPYQTATKQAQQSVDEVNSGNGCCYALPYDILKNFQKLSKRLKQTFDIDVTFKLNVLIMRELEKYFEQDGDENHETGQNISDELTGTEPTNSEQFGGDSGNDGYSSED